MARKDRKGKAWEGLSSVPNRGIGLETHRKGRNEGGKGRRRDQTIAEEGLFHPIFDPVQKEERTNTAWVAQVAVKCGNGTNRSQ